MNIVSENKKPQNGNMPRLSIDNVPRDLKLAFKSYVVGMDLTMQEAVILLLERELAERWLEKKKKP